MSRSLNCSFSVDNILFIKYCFDSTLIGIKEDIVIFNPKKGMQFTRKLIHESPDLYWVPIQNMTRSQVKDLMMKAKIYVDFGYHPGKDRLSREAALCGCCIVTGKQGSAGFYEDIPIDENSYKYNQRNKDIKIIIEKIRFVLKNYESCISDFEFYRKTISYEKQEFENDAIALLCMNGKTLTKP